MPLDAVIVHGPRLQFELAGLWWPNLDREDPRKEAIHVPGHARSGAEHLGGCRCEARLERGESTGNGTMS